MSVSQFDFRKNIHTENHPFHSNAVIYFHYNSWHYIDYLVITASTRELIQKKIVRNILYICKRESKNDFSVSLDFFFGRSASQEYYQITDLMCHLKCVYFRKNGIFSSYSTMKSSYHRRDNTQIYKHFNRWNSTISCTFHALIEAIPLLNRPHVHYALTFLNWLYNFIETDFTIRNRATLFWESENSMKAIRWFLMMILLQFLIQFLFYRTFFYFQAHPNSFLEWFAFFFFLNIFE